MLLLLFLLIENRCSLSFGFTWCRWFNRLSWCRRWIRSMTFRTKPWYRFRWFFNDANTFPLQITIQFSSSSCFFSSRENLTNDTNHRIDHKQSWRLVHYRVHCMTDKSRSSLVNHDQSKSNNSIWPFANDWMSIEYSSFFDDSNANVILFLGNWFLFSWICFWFVFDWSKKNVLRWIRLNLIEHHFRWWSSCTKWKIVDWIRVIFVHQRIDIHLLGNIFDFNRSFLIYIDILWRWIWINW